MMIRLGFAKKDITPDFPVHLAGYFSKDRFSEGIHDRLYARALAFLSEDKPFVLLQLDLLCLDALCIGRLREVIGRFGLLKDSLLVCCVHTHSGFGGMLDTANGMNREMVPLYGACDQTVVDFLTARCLDAIGAAIADARKTPEGGPAGDAVRIRMSRGSVKGLATNRHDPAAPCDDGLFLVEFLRADGKKILLYNLCCHPTVLNAHNRLVSADFPGAVAALLEREALSGPGSGDPDAYDMVLFVNGSAGDMSTRFTRTESSFAECERFGALIRKAITETIGRGEFEALEEARLEYRSVGLMRAEVPAPEAAEQRLAGMRKNLEETKNSTADPRLVRKAESFVEGAEISLLKARYPRRGDEISVETGLLSLNGQKILCVPLELFSSLALRRKNLVFFGYANALLGYLADREAYDAMDYEALFSEFARGEGERYMELLLGVTEH
ncbi:MAG: neutral/alkaline non-lysosomal ceramidase N-terminal domain-containing protein [Treponema sp.]|jgi:hypothetical protein|nr:neutral/alkaline non-lysosomal ceramidase N-terminal domain-containing protein [Treponema sp.]